MEPAGNRQISSQFSSMIYRPITGAEGQRELEQLLGRHFPVPAGASFYDDFPVWDERHGRKIFRVGAWSAQKKLIASASVRLAELKCGHATVPVALIGAVVTDEEYRGLGLASETVARVLHWALQNRATAVFLWGSEHSLYQRMGFELCGAQVRVSLGELLKSRPPGASRPAVKTGWNPALMKLLENREQGLAVRADDIGWISAHKNVRWWWTGDALAPGSYAALGKGMDLAGLVHEWGGDPADCLEIFRSIQAASPTAELLGPPARMDRWGFAFPEGAIEFLAMAKVLDPRAIHAAFHPGKPVPEFPLDPSELAPAIFGPFNHPLMPPGLYPVPLWLWGLDGA